SEEFRVDDSTMAEAFYVHARGLFHQRCGIAKEEPYTHWPLKKCHPFCYRGTFTPHDGHYGKSKDNSRQYGFRDSEGNSIAVRHFKLIKQNAPNPPEKLELCGGWHDAADWDRRPYHLGIVGDLAAVYLLRPQNFIDGQLNIPESGNGIPDILDEALWGIDYLRKSQLPDGGVGTWIETTRHPGYPELSSTDTLVYYLSCATRNSTLEYAAYAAELALALKKAGADKQADLFRDSATLAWNYAMDVKNTKTRRYHYDDQLISYTENYDLSAEYVVKAGVNLYQLWKDKKYISTAESAIKDAVQTMHKRDWTWSPLMWIELEIFPLDSVELEKLRNNRGRRLVKEAENMLRQQEDAYPIRLNWRGPREAWVQTTSWGTYHPLRRARTFVAAHAITGGSKYLDGACLANDFNNGANPTGTSMTSGLGRVYPVQFLHLDSYSDGIAEFVPGITPYRNTYGIPRAAIDMAFGMYYQARPHHLLKEVKQSFLPRGGLSEDECAKEMNKIWPIWRRWGNVESLTVAASEFTVYETIAPAMAVTGYLLNGPQAPEKEWVERRPASDIRQLPGYAPLP
ncbi:MAG: glycoside hydrolase family 9 protein, partial [Victivallales bacterium]|nr:glycoside hydrolase family 9 protein [Victivallales bacterium]